jgi:hypothetical protein
VGWAGGVRRRRAGTAEGEALARNVTSSGDGRSPGGRATSSFAGIGALVLVMRPAAGVGRCLGWWLSGRRLGQW